MILQIAFLSEAIVAIMVRDTQFSSFRSLLLGQLLLGCGTYLSVSSIHTSYLFRSLTHSHSQVLMDMVYTAFVFPVTEAWGLGGAESLLDFEFAVACIFLADVFIKLHLPYLARYKNEKLLLTKGTDIFYVYLTSDTLITDFMSAATFFIVTLIYITPIGAPKWLIYLRLVRLVRLWNVILLVKGLFVGTWVQAFLSSPMSNLISSGGALALAMLYCAAVIVNLLGCCWWAVGNYNGYPPEETWQYHVSGLAWLPNGVYQLGIPQQYVVSVYYVVTTLTTTGYGDIYPCNTTEMAWAMVTMIVAALFFAFIVGSFVRTMLDSGAEAKRSQRFKDKAEAVELFLETCGISPKLSRQVYRYYSDVWLRQQEEVEMWQAIDDLGPTLKSRVIAEVASPYLRILAPLANLTDESIIQIASILEPWPLAPDQELCKQGDDALLCWILIEGCITSIKGGKDTRQMTWAPGFLGAIALRVIDETDGRPPLFPAGIRTVNSCLVFSIKVANLKCLLDDNPDLSTLRAGLIKTSKVDNDGLLGSDTRRPVILKKAKNPPGSQRIPSQPSYRAPSLSLNNAISRRHLSVGIDLSRNSRYSRSYGDGSGTLLEPASLNLPADPSVAGPDLTGRRASRTSSYQSFPEASLPPGQPETSRPLQLQTQITAPGDPEVKFLLNAMNNP